MGLYTKNNFIFGLILCISFTLAVYLPLFESILFSFPPSKTHYDYTAHIQVAERILEGKFTDAHFLFHILTVLVFKLFAFKNISIQYSALIVVLFSEIISALILYIFFYRRYDIMLTLLCVMSLMIFSPIYLLLNTDNFFYIGYLNPNTLHSPTLITLRPFAVLIFVLTEKIFFLDKYEYFTFFIFCLLILLSALAKPSYIIIMLPALLCLYLWHRNEIDGTKVMICSILILGVLVWMYKFTYFSANTTEQVSKVILTFSHPFKLAFFWTQNYEYILLKFICSVIFPIYVLLKYFDKLFHDILFQNAFLLLLFGLFFYGFFMESGPRQNDGNFMWSAELAALPLFIASLRVFLDNQMLDTHRSNLGWLILAIHVLCGVAYYIRIFLGYKFF